MKKNIICVIRFKYQIILLIVNTYISHMFRLDNVIKSYSCLHILVGLAPATPPRGQLFHLCASPWTKMVL